MEDHERRGRIRKTTDHPRVVLSVTWSMSIVVATMAFASVLLLTDSVSGWSLSVMHGRKAFGSAAAVRRPVPLTLLYAEKPDDRISATDARVLQSMLRDNKLDLEQEYNMKKLLERGVRKDEDEEDDPFAKFKTPEEQDDDEEIPYSSQVIKTLADTKFWQAFKRNAGEVLESVAIAVGNEIEKGAKVLVGLGFFAWDRAKKDVARALPTAATVPQKKVFQLGETSSYVEPVQEEEETEKEMTPSERARSIRQEFTTPADELSAVTAEIGRIFQRADRQVSQQSQVDKSKDMRNPFFAAFVEERELQKQKAASGDGESTPFYASETLSTTASRGTSRLDTAFQRAKKTKLAREKENLAVKGNRLVSGAIDSAYQVKTEISSEVNVPGYKTKQLRESTVDATKRLAGAAKKTAGFLGGASAFLLGGNNKDPQQQQLPQAGDAAADKVKADPVDFLDDASYFAFKRETPPETPPVAETATASEEAEAGGSPFGFLGNAFKKEEPPPMAAEDDLSGGVVIEDNKVIDPNEPESGGAFGFLRDIAKRGMGGQDEASPEGPTSTMASAAPSPPSQPEVEIITDAEVVMGNKDNFNYFDADDTARGDSKAYFATNDYLDNMDASTSTSTAEVADVVDDGLRQVTAEVISDDDFDETVFGQAKAVDNLSAEELLRQQAAEEAEENSEPNFVTKAVLRTLDVAFVVVEKGVSVAPAAFTVAQRAATRATEAKLKDSSGSQIGWETHNGNIRGENRY